MRYRLDMKPLDEIIPFKLHKQLNGLQQLSTKYSYAGECLNLKFSKDLKKIDITIFDAKSGKIIIAKEVYISPERNLNYLYFLFKDDLGYKYLDKIFPSTIFNQ